MFFIVSCGFATVEPTSADVLAAVRDKENGSAVVSADLVSCVSGSIDGRKTRTCKALVTALAPKKCHLCEKRLVIGY